MATTDLDEIISQHSLSPYQWRFMCVMGLAYMADMAVFAAIGQLIKEVSGLYGLPAEYQGLYFTVASTGMFFGAAYWTRICDVYGRRPVFIGTVALDGAAFLLITPWSHYFPMFVCLFAIGFGTGGGIATRTTLLVEWIPKERRGCISSFLGLCWPIGSTLFIMVSFGILGNVNYDFCGGAECGWRALFLVMGLFHFVILVLSIRQIPESLRWLQMRGRESDVHALLQRSFGLQTCVDLTPAPVSTQAEESPMRMLFLPKFRRSTILFWLIWFTLSTGSNTYLVLLPTVVKDSGFAAGTAKAINFALYFGGIPGAFFTAVTMDSKWGRRVTLTTCLSVSALSLALLLVPSARQSGSVLGMASFMQQASALAAWNVLFTYTAEVYPTTLRSRAVGVANMLNRLGGSIGPYWGGELLAHSTASALSLFSAALAVAAFASCFLDIETRGHCLTDHLQDDQTQQGRTG